MAVPAGGIPSESQTGDTIHLRGGQSVDFLTGTFVKSINAATRVVTYQDANGMEQTATLTGGGGALSDFDTAQIAKVPGLDNAIPDIYSLERDHAWSTSVEITFDVFATEPTNTELENATYVSSYTFSASDMGNRWAVLRFGVDDLRQFRLALTIGSEVYHFPAALFSHQHNSGPDHYAVGLVAPTPTGAVLTLERRDDLNAAITRYRGITEADRTTVDGSAFGNHIPITVEDVQAALEAIDGTDFEEVFYLNFISDLPAATLDRRSELYYVRSTNAWYQVYPFTSFGTLPTGTFDNAPGRANLQLRRGHNVATGALNLNGWEYDGNNHHFYHYPSPIGTRAVQDTPTNALAESRSVNTYDVVFLGQFTSDNAALGHTPTIAADTDYFYVEPFASGLLFRLKRLDLAGYTPGVAPSTLYEWGFAFPHVIVNPTGEATGTANTLQVGESVYDFDLTGSAIAIRDQINSAENPQAGNGLANQNIMGNFWRAGTNGASILDFSSWVENDTSSNINWRVLLQRATLSGSTWTMGAIIYETGAGDVYVRGNGEHELMQTLETPAIMSANEYFFVGVVRHDSASAARAIFNIGSDLQGNFTSIADFPLDLEWVDELEDRRGSLDAPPPGTTYTMGTGGAPYQQRITYDMGLSGGDIAEYRGSIVVPNPSPVDASQILLETLSVNGTTLRVQPPVEDGEVTLRTDYLLSENRDNTATDSHRTMGAIFHALPHDFLLHEVKMEAEVLINTTYTAYLCYLNRVSSTEFVITSIVTGGGVLLAVPGVISELDFAFDRQGVSILGDSYFAILVYTATANATGRVRQRQNGTETFDDVVAFEYVTEARASGDVSVGNDLYYNAADYRPYMEISVDVTVPRVLDVWSDGSHLISAPEEIDFRSNITSTVLPGTRRVRIDVDDLDIGAAVGRVTEQVTETAQGVLYITRNFGGTGFLSIPTVTISGGGGTGATGVAVLDGTGVRNIYVTNRGTGYTSAPTVAITGGGGTGTNFVAHEGTYYTPTQDFTDTADSSRGATATFELTRGLVDADGDRMCHISFNPGEPSDVGLEFLRTYLTPFPVQDLLDLPAMAPADLPIGDTVHRCVPAVPFLPNRAEDNPRVSMAGDTFGRNGLFLFNVSGGTANRIFIFARGAVLRSMSNIRFELRP